MLIQNDFMPTTLAGWVTLAGGLLALLTTVVVWVLKSVRAPLLLAIEGLGKHVEAKAREHGERIGKVETACEKNELRINEVEKSTERLDLRFLTMTQTVERMDVHLKQTLAQMQGYHERRLEDSRSIGERLASIETRLSMPPASHH